MSLLVPAEFASKEGGSAMGKMTVEMEVMRSGVPRFLNAVEENSGVQTEGASRTRMFVMEM